MSDYLHTDSFCIHFCSHVLKDSLDLPDIDVAQFSPYHPISTVVR